MGIRRWTSMVLTLFMTFQLVYSQVVLARVDNCRNILNWVYKDLTLKNLDKSYDRLMAKFLVGLHHVHQKTAPHYSLHFPYTKIVNTLINIDPDFERELAKNHTNWLSNWILRGDRLTPTQFSRVFTAWKDLQNSSPILFEGLEDKYLLDEWDQVTADTLSDLTRYEFEDDSYQTRLGVLAQSLQSAQTNILSGEGFDLEALINQVEMTEDELQRALNGKYKDALEQYGEVCSPKDLGHLIQTENYVCPIEKQESNFTLQLRQLGDILSDSEVLLMKKPDLKVGANSQVKVLDYERNDVPESTYCIRDPDIAEMIVVHHTQLNNTTTPEQINRLHLNRTAGSEPWHMVGYNYMLSETYPPGELTLIQGRRDNMKGAHAGGFTAPLTQEQREFYGKQTVLCGNRHIGFKRESALTQVNEEGGISGNLVSYGVAVIGNYAPVEYEEINGVQVPVNPFSTVESPIASEAILRKLAQFSCDLQKEHPRVKKILPHSYFRNTVCPGTLRDQLDQVARYAKEYGCDFDVIYQKPGAEAQENQE